VGREIKALREVFETVYHYNVEEFRIPDASSHAAVSKKIDAFVEVNDDSSEDLKIVHYPAIVYFRVIRNLYGQRMCVSLPA